MFLLLACAGEEGIPENVMNKEQFIAVMVDVHIVEATAQLRQVKTKDDLAKAVLTDYQEAFEQHNITEEAFKQSFEYYLDHPKLLHEVYEEVFNELTRMQDEVH